jgi:hypothetical protein
MKAYVITENYTSKYSDYEKDTIVGVSLSEEKAKELCAEYNKNCGSSYNYSYEEFDLK